MTKEYTKLLQSTALQKLPKSGFLVEKYTIWQLGSGVVELAPV
jgi:hypothetical protein